MIPGVQVSSLKPLLLSGEQVRHAFHKIRSMGCDTVQLQWIDPSVPIHTIADALRESGLSSVSVQDFYESIRENKEYYLRLNRETGGRWMCVSRIPDRLKTLPGLDQYIEELRAFQTELDSFGQRLCFHPVSADFSPIEGVNPVEYLLGHMPELNICLDLYHLNRCGYDMPEWIEKYAPRICMVHFKDEKNGSLVPTGQGDTDWAGVAEACLNAGVPYAFVEQERWNRDPFDCLSEALLWLNGQIQSVSEPRQAAGQKALSLITPSPEYLESYAEACAEYERLGVSSYSFTDPKTLNIFEKFENYRLERNLRPDRVGAHYFWLVDEEKKRFVGEICIRRRLNAALERCGGHIGYGIRPGEWNRGFGTLMLSMALEKARAIGLTDVLITCNDDNAASAKVMEKNGLRLADIIENKSEGNIVRIRRYRIRL